MPELIECDLRELRCHELCSDQHIIDCQRVLEEEILFLFLLGCVEPMRYIKPLFAEVVKTTGC